MSRWRSGRGSRCPKASTPDGQGSAFALSAPRAFRRKEDSPPLHLLWSPSVPAPAQCRGGCWDSQDGRGLSLWTEALLFAQHGAGPGYRERITELQPPPNPSTAWLCPVSPPPYVVASALPSQPSIDLPSGVGAAFYDPPHLNRFRPFLCPKHPKSPHMQRTHTSGEQGGGLPPALTSGKHRAKLAAVLHEHCASLAPMSPAPVSTQLPLWLPCHSCHTEPVMSPLQFRDKSRSHIA